VKTLPFALIIFLVRPALAQEREKPLPEITKFLEEFQVKRAGMFEALMDVRIDSTGQYTYTESCTEITLDSKGNTKNRATDIYEIIPTGKPLRADRRQTVKAGVPVSQKELDKQDHEFKAMIAKQEAEEQKRKAAAAARPRQEQEPNPQPAQSNFFLRLYQFQMVGREMLDSRPVIHLTFKSDPGYKPGQSFEKMLHHLSGSVWVSENDFELARIEAAAIERITFGGFLASFQPGSKIVMEWRKFNNEVWLPHRREYVADGRILLLKGMHQHVTSEFSDFHKYSVDTDLQSRD
jgi:hypothetical protein